MKEDTFRIRLMRVLARSAHQDQLLKVDKMAMAQLVARLVHKDYQDV